MKRRHFSAGGSRANSSGARIVRGGRAVVEPPPLKPGQVRCEGCRQAVTPKPSGGYRKHRDLFGNECFVRAPAADVAAMLAAAPPIVIPPMQPRMPAVMKTEPPRIVTGACHDCSAAVSGERRYCGRCAARRTGKR